MLLVYKVIIFYHFAIATITTALFVEKYLSCDSASENLVMVFGPKRADGLQSIDVNLSTSLELGDNTEVKGLFDVKRGTNGDQWTTIFRVAHPKGFCDYMGAYLQDVWTELQKKLGMENKCPIKTGNYSVKNFLLNYNKIMVKTMPFGRIRHAVDVYHKQTNKKLLCGRFFIKN